MIFGIPKEIKEHEYRVAIVPAGVRTLVQASHRVLIEKGAGLGSDISDEEFQKAGATLLPSREEVFGEAEMIMKVKEPLPEEYGLLRTGQILYSYLHLAASPSLTQALLEREIIGVAYETVQLESGLLPLLTPMSEIAGRMAIQEGAKYLEKEEGGRGVLLGGVPGVEPGRVTILGGGIVGTNAAKIAVGLGADTTLLDIHHAKLAYLDDLFGNRIKALMSNYLNILQALSMADVVVGSVLIPGAKAPRLITEEMLDTMKKGSVLIDVAIDQGGCAESSRPTSLSHPTYVHQGVIHYCVTNMPSAVARTSTYALTNTTLPYVLLIANHGFRKALQDDSALAKGLNLFSGKVTHRAVAQELGYRYFSPASLLNKRFSRSVYSTETTS